MDILEFIQKFKSIQDLGFIKSQRSGPTGIGYTLEKLIGKDEDNIALPDLEGAELKAHRINSNCLITLFTFNKKCWVINPLEAVKKYGSLDKYGRQGLYYTMGTTPNSAG